MFFDEQSSILCGIIDPTHTHALKATSSSKSVILCGIIGNPKGERER